MSPTPEDQDDERHFDPRSEVFLESLRNLIEFKVRRENFDANCVEIHHLYSRSMVDALDFATNELKGPGWFIMSITRMWDEEDKTTNDEGFITMMQQMFQDPGDATHGQS